LAKHIKVDVPLLRQTGQRLGEISATLKRAESDGGHAAAAMAQPDLTKVMRDFEKNWRHHRGQLLAHVDGHQKVVVAAADAYEKLEQAQAKALEGPPK
jgi:hypothetical protein